MFCLGLKEAFGTLVPLKDWNEARQGLELKQNKLQKIKTLIRESEYIEKKFSIF